MQYKIQTIRKMILKIRVKIETSMTSNYCIGDHVQNLLIQ